MLMLLRSSSTCKMRFRNYLLTGLLLG